MKRSLLAALLLVAGLQAYAQEMPVPVELQARIFIKVLLFDRSYERRAEDGIVVAVLYQEAFRRSFLAAEEFVQAAAAGWGEGGSGAVSFRCALIDVDGPRPLSESLSAAGADIIYVAPLRSYDVGRIAQASLGLRLPAYTGVPEYLPAGLGISLDLRDEKPRILINLKASKESGAQFGSQMLSLARIVDDGERKSP